MREGKDRRGKWLIEHYGDAVLHLAGIRGFKSWRAIQPQVVQQGRTPDGLSEVMFPGEKEADFFLFEIYVMASMKYDIVRMSKLLGGIRMLTENPLLKMFFAEKSTELLQNDILDVLEARFGEVPDDLSSSLRVIKKEK